MWFTRHTDYVERCIELVLTGRDQVKHRWFLYEFSRACESHNRLHREVSEAAQVLVSYRQRSPLISALAAYATGEHQQLVEECEAAGERVAWANCLLGMLYTNNEGKSLQYLQRAAQLGSVHALVMLQVKQRGTGAKKFSPEALQVLRKVSYAKDPHPDACTHLAFSLSNSGEEAPEKCNLLQRSYDAGNFYAAGHLGDHHYQLKRGSRADELAAARCYRNYILLVNPDASTYHKRLSEIDATPYGVWNPQNAAQLSPWMPDELIRALRTVLLCHKREGNALSLLPRPIVLEICMFVVTA